MTGMVPAAASELFRRTFSSDATVVATAPGRVNLIGEHLDYNGGQVLPIAIEKSTAVAIALSEGRLSKAVSANEMQSASFDIRRPKRAGSWWDYIAGVAANLNMKLPQVNIAVASDVPSGAGLSSSAALEVAAGLAMTALSGMSASLVDLAKAGWRAENNFVGVQSGIMDQYASALGDVSKAVHIWCDTDRTEYVPFDGVVLVFDTGVRRSLRSSQFNQRRLECQAALAILRKQNPELPNLATATREEIEAVRLPQPLNRRAAHVVGENARVEDAVANLKDSGVLPGHLLYESHASLRDDYACSCPELDWFVERMMNEPGVSGARLTGAGWGGSAIAVGDSDALLNAAERLTKDYKQAFWLTARTWITRAARGATLVTETR